MPESQRTVIVTGAAGQVGSAICQALAESGAQVVCADVADTGDVVQAASKAGGTATGVHLDVADPASWQAAVGQAEATYGHVGALVNVAGINLAGSDSIAGVDLAAWRRVLDVNVIGMALGMGAALPSMRRGGQGRIINVASVAGLRGAKNNAAYSASKGAVISLTRQAAIELAEFDITVNGVAPGMLEAGIGGRDRGAQWRLDFIARQPIPRAVLGPDIAGAIQYFLSPGAAIVTGQILAVDAGWSASL
jgi:NAD(P)-dependent dehydrogenase (short-subunit alcohol dehydrogenase family)